MNYCRWIINRQCASCLYHIQSWTNCRKCPRSFRALSTGVGSDAEAEVKPRLRAVDLAKKVRDEKAKSQAGAPCQKPVSALQQRVTELRRLTQQLQHVHPNVLAKHLHRGVLYQDKNVVVINKPYGVIVRDELMRTCLVFVRALSYAKRPKMLSAFGCIPKALKGGEVGNSTLFHVRTQRPDRCVLTRLNSDDSATNSISSVLPVLSKMMEGMKVKSDSQLLPCLGLEKEVTGALLLARSAKAVERISNLHTHNQVIRKYCAVIVGVPVPSEGVIDIPLIEREVTGVRPHYKMSLSPLFKINESGDGLTKNRAHRQALPAVTKYKVLDSGSGCSLVELQPLTDVKHQLRVHMAFALSCPILGDHKYSHWNKLAPQKLPERVLKKLKLEQSKSRNLPLHLHARQLTLQQTSEAEINVTCSLPKYFFQTMGLLHLTLADVKDV